MRLRRPSLDQPARWPARRCSLSCLLVTITERLQLSLLETRNSRLQLPAPGVPGIPALFHVARPGAALPQPAPAPGPEVQADLMATRLQSVDAELKATTDPVRQSDLQAEKLQLETKLRSKQVIDQTKNRLPIWRRTKRQLPPGSGAGQCPESRASCRYGRRDY